MRVILTIFLIASSVLFSSMSVALAKDTDKDLKNAAQDIDKAAVSPQGAEKVTASLSEKFNVPESTIQDLRAQRLGFGEISILLALSQSTGKPTSELLQKFRSGEGWGKIAKDEGVKLGQVISAVEKANPAIAETNPKGMGHEGTSTGSGRGGTSTSSEGTHGGSIGGGIGGGMGGGMGGGTGGGTGHGGGHGR